MNPEYNILRDHEIKPEEIESLRTIAGWDKMEGKYALILPKLYTYYSVRIENELVGFLSILSDGVGDAFLLDLMVHPDHQRKGIGTALVKEAIHDIKSAGVKCIQVTFNPDLESFYKKFGFHIFKAGIIDNDTMKLSSDVFQNDDKNKMT